ncbi:TPA: ABC transporter permease, partial [Candidatus Micrarchaeota archaeon]|nr:ABC transporter permease [Candidatus Micrarchaeota archaeon]
INEHPIVSKKFKDYGLKVINMKYELLNSPGNQVLGYVLLAFSFFSIIASVITVYIFYSCFSYERLRTLATLKVLGFTKKDLITILLLEGIFYLIVSSTLGTILGIFVGKELLTMIKKAINFFLEGTMIYVEDIPYTISLKTFIIGFSVGIFLPFLILLFFSLKLVKNPAVHFLKEIFLESESIKRKRVTGVLLIVTGAILLFLEKSYITTLGLSLIFLGLSFMFRFLSLPSALFLIFFSIYKSENGVYDLLAKGASFFIASFLLILGLIPILRKISKKQVSVTALVSFSYLERFPKRSYTLGFIFGIIVLIMILMYTIPHNITKFMNERIKEGLFGYDFMVFKNPLKLLD